jgi:hypothetical protein
MSDYRHVVLFSFRPDTPEEVKKEALQILRNLGEDCGGHEAGILDWQVDWNLDMRKGVHIVEVALFRDEATFLEFKRHPAHNQASELMSSISDWQIGDIVQ